MDSEEEDFYYSSGGDEMDEASENDGDEEEPDYAPVGRLQKPYKILKEEDIKQLQDNDISTVSNALSVSRSSACTLLCRKNWNISSVYDDWFAAAADDERAASEPVSILPAKRKSRKQDCKICLEKFSSEKMISASCGHLFCDGCWRIYISTAINDGAGCLTLSCPEPKCRADLGFEMVDLLASADEKDKYYRYLRRSYVEENRNMKWCPAPGCDFAVEFDAGGGIGVEISFDVTCDCSYKFCWNCAEECHRPVSCDTVAKWTEKNRSEAENTTWIIAYTKPCPKCHRAIEKNQGCNHMTCRNPCRHEFCWVCLGDWLKHNASYGCNRYDGDSKEEKSRKMAKQHLERYTHYYERFDSNDKSRKKAMYDLNLARNEHIETLSRVQEEYTQAQLKFVIEAWEQIVECRQVLKWTYAYGYFLSLDEPERLEFFGYLQGAAEGALERLHYGAEKEMDKYLKAECPSEDFQDFRTKLVDRTTVTRNYFANLVRALENNLSEVENCGAKVTD